MRANLPRTALFTGAIALAGLEVNAAGRSKVSRAFGLRRLTVWVLLGFGLAALATVGANNWRARAATNRFVSASGNDMGGTNNCTNSGQPCKTIQNAVDHSGAGDLIQVGPGTYVENVEVSQNVTIQGDGTTGSTVNGNESGSVFTIDGGFNVTLNSLTIKNGNFGAGGGIANNRGSVVTIVGCTLNNNHAPGGNGGGVSNDSSSSSLTIINSTISGNSAGLLGGGLENAGSCAIVNSTIGGNLAQFGGGILNLSTATVVNSTMFSNSAFDASGIGNGSNATLRLTNTIIAGPGAFGGRECVNFGAIVVNSHNLIADLSCHPALSLDPKLGPLQNNGGPTFTQALLPGSPAIDAGDDSVLGPPLFLTTDQRGPGFPRKSGLHVDIGAFEVQQFDTCLTNTSTGNLLQWNSTTGQYKFTRCSDGFMLTGTGVVKLVNGIRTLTDFKSDRRISAGFNTGQLTGNATIYLMVAQGVWQSFQIVDTNPGATCSCVVPIK